MRVAVLGGTRFIGRALVEALLGAGHTVLVVHRGVTEPDGQADAEHLHCERSAMAGPLREWAPDAVIDNAAMTALDADAAIAAMPSSIRSVAVSSVDVYRAHGSLHRGAVTDALPVDETAPLRDGPLPYGEPGYDKLAVESAYLAAGATICRPTMTYGPHDHQRREGPILDRIRRGEPTIPVGQGNLLWSKAYVDDVADGIRRALELGDERDVFNLAERRTVAMSQWFQWIVEDAGASVEFVRVPTRELPDDLRVSGFFGQHVLFDAAKARSVLGWTDRDPREGLRTSVTWHLAHPPAD